MKRKNTWMLDDVLLLLLLLMGCDTPKICKCGK